jgi:hypothetical protein
MTILRLKPTRPWQAYNEGLLQLTSTQRCSGVIIASGCGHFIQQDNPRFVAVEVCELLEKLRLHDGQNKV